MTGEFGEFVLNMRVAAGLSREELGHHLCLSVTTLEAYEREEKVPEDREKFELYLREVVKEVIREKRRFMDVRFTTTLESVVA